MTTCTPHLHQLHFQGFNDNNSAADADDCTSLAAIDTSFSRNVDTIFGLRFEIEETANCSSMNNQFHIQHNILGAGYVTTTTSTSGVRLANGVPNDTLATTDRVSGSALGFVAGEYDEEGTTANVTLQNQHSEMHFVLTLVGANLNNDDTITFRVISGAATLTEYHVTPTITAVKVAGSTLSRDVQDTLSFSDALARDGGFTRDVSDAFSFTDQLARDLELDRLLSESFAFTDQTNASVQSPGSAQTHERDIQDTFSFTEQVERLLDIDRLLQDSLSFSDQVQRDQDLTREIAETLTFLDNLAYTSTGESPAEVELPIVALKWLVRTRRWRSYMGRDPDELVKFGIGPGKIRDGGGG